MQRLCSTQDIEEGKSKGFRIDDEGREHNVFAVHKDGKFYVYRNSCPHVGVNLEWQPDQFLDMEANFIQCSMHGALFLIDTGMCILGPCQGQRLKMIEHHIEGDQIYITL